MIENIEYFLHLKINISRNSITVKSTDSKADIQIVKQAKFDDMVSKLKGSAIVEEDEARKALKREFNIKDENIETVFLDEKEDIIREKVEKLMSEGEDEEKLLVIYPFSQIYNTKDTEQISFIAADTFRAAAVEQLKVWGERNGVRVFAGNEGCDAAGLCFDGLNEAIKQNEDIVFIR